MEKIKRSPLETIKTVVIAILTLSMLALAALFIGGSQFLSSSSAIVAAPMPGGAVAVGEDAPNQTELYEKELLKVSYIGIRYGDIGGGAYATEQAAKDLLEFSLEGVHELLSADAQLTRTDENEFAQAIDAKRYLCLSLISPLPYQIIYALSGEYISPVGFDQAVNPETLMLAFDAEGKASLYMRDGDSYYVSYGDYITKPSELLAMASDSRLYEFGVSCGLPLAENSPLVQPLSISKAEIPSGEALEAVLTLFDYDRGDSQSMATTDTHNVVAPHGNLLCTEGRIIYNAASEGGISMLDFSDGQKSELDMGVQDILWASVSLIENLRTVCESSGAPELDIYLDGFYRSDDTYTVVFGICEDGIPIKGSALPYFAKITVQSGKFKGMDMRLVTSEKTGYAFSPFSSAWEYRHAAKSARLHSIGLCYNASSLPTEKLGAAWYYTGERTVEK